MDSPRRFVLADAMIAIAIGGLALVLYGAIRFPASVSAAWIPFVMSIVGLLAYLVVGVLARRASIPIQSVLRLGGVVGLALAAAGVVNHTLEIAVQLPSALGAVLGPGMWGLMFLGFSIACSATVGRSGSLGIGLLSSAWCGLVYAGVLVVFALAVGFAFMPHMVHSLAGLYAASGMSDPEAFVTRHLVTNASSHIFIAPTIALVIGAVGGLACLLLRSVRRRTAIALSGASVILFVAGAMSIHVAESLPRAQRPPFIQFGLAALAITLASAHPLLVAVRAQRTEATDRVTA
jgi:hypothetical protein